MTFDWLQLGILLPCVAGVASSYLPWQRARFWGALLGLAGQPGRHGAGACLRGRFLDAELAGHDFAGQGQAGMEAAENG